MVAVLLLVTRPLTNWPAQQPAGMTTQHAAPHHSHGTGHTTSLLYQYCSQATDDMTDSALGLLQMPLTDFETTTIEYS